MASTNKEDSKKESKIIFMFEEFIDSSCSRVVREIIEKVNGYGAEEDIRLFINSPGGIVIGLLSIIDTMEMISNDVETTCVGQAASCGAVLLACGTKGKRFITRNSRVLLHQLSGGAWGHVKDIKTDAKEVDRLNELILSILSKRTGRSVNRLKRDMERDLWLNAEQAVSYGLADKIV